MGRGLTATFTTGNVTASGGTLGYHKTGLPNAFNILKVKLVPSAGSGASTIQVMQKDTLTTTDLVLEWKAVSGNVYDPMDYSSGSPVEMPATDIIATYDDEDSTGEAHFKFTNNDSVDKTYDGELTYEEVPVFDASNVMSVSKAELLGDKLYFGGRTSSHAMIRRSSTNIEAVLGDESAYTAFLAATLFSTSAGVFLGGVAATDILLTKSGANLYILKGDSSGFADVTAKNGTMTGGSLNLTGATSSDILFKKGGAHLLQIRKGDDSDYADVQCGTLAPATFNYTYGFFTGTGAYTNFQIADGFIISAS